jgi:hypothetical protein
MLLVLFLAAAEGGADAGKAIALALGIGPGAPERASASATSSLDDQAVARQPVSAVSSRASSGSASPHRAVVFYGLIGGLLAYVLV